MKKNRVTIKFIDGEVYQTTDLGKVVYRNGSAMVSVEHGENTDMFNVSQIKYIVFDEVE